MQKSTHLCEVCAAPFTPRRSVTRTCSKQCMRKRNNAIQNAKRRAARQEIRCEGCGDSFLPHRADSRHCSPRCRRVVLARGQRTERIGSRAPRACPVCGSDISERRADALTCSSACSARNQPAYLAYRTVCSQQRRARVRAAQLGYGVPLPEWRRIVRRADGRCVYCGARAALTMDHVVPIVRGGRHCIGNIAPACKPCNSSKGTRLLMEWRRDVRRRATTA